MGSDHDDSSPAEHRSKVKYVFSTETKHGRIVRMLYHHTTPLRGLVGDMRVTWAYVVADRVDSRLIVYDTLFKIARETFPELKRANVTVGRLSRRSGMHAGKPAIKFCVQVAPARSDTLIQYDNWMTFKPDTLGTPPELEHA